MEQVPHLFALSRFGAGLLTPPAEGATAGLQKLHETSGRAVWLGPPLFAAVPETGHSKRLTYMLEFGL